jgi:hypothetical protein
MLNERNGQVAPHGLLTLILAFSQYLVRVRNKNTYAMAEE